MKRTTLALALVGMLPMVSSAKAPVIQIVKEGNEKFSVCIQVANAAFTKCLARNLEMSGLFSVGPSGAIRVAGAPGAIVAEGSGKRVPSSVRFADDRSAREAARRLSDAMVEAYSDGKQKGFAMDRIVFLNRGRQFAKGVALPSEIHSCYPDGMDIRQHTSDRKMSIFPRWKRDRESILYIGDLRGAPQIWECNLTTGKRFSKWSFKGTPAGISISPDGSRVAAILSIHGAPDLYVLDMASGNWQRLTNTPLVTEGSPTWSPDGRKIAFVSDETRSQQIYSIDVATKARHRLTSRGQNMDPDWGPDGRIAYISRRGAAYVAVMDSSSGDASASLITQPSNWEHPSWSRDGRHVVASRDRAIFLVDTVKDGDQPKQMFFAKGNWINPTWSR